MKTAGILLAAGASRRFGPDDKLLAIMNGAPLVTHAAKALRDFAPDRLIAVVRDPAVADLLDGFDVVFPDAPDPAQSDSLRAGLARADALGADRVMIALGDMPFVTARLLGQVAALCTDHRPSALTDGQRPMPPACFPNSCLPELLTMTGDRGAARLLRDLPEDALVRAPSKILRDIDTLEQLTSAQSP